MFFQNLAFILPSFQQFLLKRILVFSHKMVFIENEAALLRVTMRERARASTCSYNLVYNFLIYLLPLKSSVFEVHFLIAFWHWNEAFPEGSSQNEVVCLLVIFHLEYSKCRGGKICFYSCNYQNQNFSPVSRSCCSCSNRVALVSFVQHSCCTCVAVLSIVLHSCLLCRNRVAFVSFVSGARVVNQITFFHFTAIHIFKITLCLHLFLTFQYFRYAFLL